MTEGLNDIMINAVKLLTTTMTDGANEPGDVAAAAAFRSVDGMNRTINLMQSMQSSKKSRIYLTLSLKNTIMR